jgi:hypothetical protein
MEVSAVVDSRTGQSKKSNVRTSTGAFFGRGYDEVVRRIEKRIAQVTMIPIGEDVWGAEGQGGGGGARSPECGDPVINYSYRAVMRW